MEAAAGNHRDLTGATVLVTGAWGGIGREIAILPSSRHARVALGVGNLERRQETRARLSGEGRRIEVFYLDDFEAIPPWFKSFTAKTGPLNGLVRAAGKRATMPIRLAAPQTVDDLLPTNLPSAIPPARGFRQKNCRATESGMVFLSSVMDLVGTPTVSVYSATNAASMGFARSLAVELAGERVRVTCVAPAFVRMKMLDQVREWLAPKRFAALEKAHPLGFWDASGRGQRSGVSSGGDRAPDHGIDAGRGWRPLRSMSGWPQSGGRYHAGSDFRD
jgi:3-oxoacyl-[acyl-carrier protein] reductase